MMLYESQALFASETFVFNSFYQQVEKKNGMRPVRCAENKAERLAET